MKFNLYSIFDTKSRVFLSPFVSRSDTDATRQIEASLKDPAVKGTPVGSHPEDFELHCMGIFDDEDGHIQKVGNGPRFVASLSTLGTVAS